MPDFTLKEILVIVFGGGGLVVGLIAALNLFFTRYDIAKKQKKEDETEENSQTAEHRRIDLDEETRNATERERILEFYKLRVIELETKLAELISHDSLSRPTITKIYSAERRLRREMDLLKWQILCKETSETISAQAEKIETALDDLRNALP